MPVKVTQSYKPLSDDEVKAYENKLGVELPGEYRDFLLLHNGGKAYPDVINYKRKYNPEASTIIDRILGLEDDQIFTIPYFKDNFSDRIPAHLLVIATDVGGNNICIAVSGDKRGQIFFWHHEFPEDDDDELPGENNFFFIASSFSEFLDKLYIPEE
jgi:cell wall assembly regulator SMI1